VKANDVKGQGPVELLLPLPQERVLGFAYVVPFLINMTSSSSGEVGMKLYRLGCLQMLEYCNFQRWVRGQPVVLTQEPRTGLEKEKEKVGACNSECDSESDSESDIGYEDGASSSRRQRYSAEELIALTASQPQLSIVVDQSAVFAPGQPLFTISVAGSGTGTGAGSDTNRRKRGTSDSNTTAPAPHCSGGEEDDELTASAAVIAKSANHVRVAMAASNVHILLRPLQTLQFLLDHFRDPQLLAECVALISPSKKRPSKKRPSSWTRGLGTQKQQSLGGRQVESSSGLIRSYARFAVMLLTLAKKYVMHGQVSVKTEVAMRVVGNGRDVVLCLDNLPGDDSEVLVACASVNLKEVVDDLGELWTAFVTKGQ
jgi:hypothetical protein